MNRIARSLIRAATLLVACAFPATLLIVGCDSGASPVSFDVPIGLYARADESVLGPTEVLRKRTIVLISQQAGVITDSLYTRRSGQWELDSVVQTQLIMGLADGGYRRVVEVRTGPFSTDSSLAYWYFFRRNDSLYYYTGDRLKGGNGSIVGNWAIDPLDTSLARRNYTLRFSHDSVRIEGRYAEGAPVSGTYRYTADRNTISAESMPVTLGPRYEVIPGLALYLTNLANHGYAVVR